jgi:hypothetical protein
MLVGAALYAEAYPHLEKNLLVIGGLGKLTLPGVLGMSAWALIPILALIFILVFVFFEKRGL